MGSHMGGRLSSKCPSQRRPDALQPSPVYSASDFSHLTKPVELKPTAGCSISPAHEFVCFNKCL